MKFLLALLLLAAMIGAAKADKVTCLTAGMDDVLKRWADRGYTVVADGKLVLDMNPDKSLKLSPMAVISNSAGDWFLLSPVSPGKTCVFLAGQDFEIVGASPDKTY